MVLIGLVGKPSAGKSTFFKSATLNQVEIGDYPFTTIKPNRGVAYVRVNCPETFFNTKCNPRTGYCINGVRFVPIQLLDVAGLVPGAHQGKGLGNQFLDDLRRAEALIHVVDFSGATNEKGEKVEPGTHDPLNDILFLEEELNHWFANIVERSGKKLRNKKGSERVKILAQQLSGLGVSYEVVKNCPILDDGDYYELGKYFREVTKPIIIAANKVDTVTGQENYERLKKDGVIPCSAAAELALREANEKGLVKYVPGSDSFEVVGELSERQEQGLRIIKSVMEKYGGTGVQKILDFAVFELLKYKAVFPGGVKGLKDKEGRVLPDCFLLPPSATALDFAYKIHKDLGDNFIKAVNVKTKQLIGRDKLLSHGDVIEVISGK